MKTRKQVKETEYSRENKPDKEYILDRLMGYIIAGMSIFLIFLKVMDSY